VRGALPCFVRVLGCADWTENHRCHARSYQEIWAVRFWLGSTYAAPVLVTIRTEDEISRNIGESQSLVPFLSRN
jgi:hypothetical protein